MTNNRFYQTFAFTFPLTTPLPKVTNNDRIVIELTCLDPNTSSRIECSQANPFKSLIYDPNACFLNYTDP